MFQNRKLREIFVPKTLKVRTKENFIKRSFMFCTQYHSGDKIEEDKTRCVRDLGGETGRKTWAKMGQY